MTWLQQSNQTRDKNNERCGIKWRSWGGQFGTCICQSWVPSAIVAAEAPVQNSLHFIKKIGTMKAEKTLPDQFGKRRLVGSNSHESPPPQELRTEEASGVWKDFGGCAAPTYHHYLCVNQA
eukprot:1160628-Pelagomonas_calceolata.AAC.7